MSIPVEFMARLWRIWGISQMRGRVTLVEEVSAEVTRLGLLQC